ncbi:hypothetical protein BGZ97_008637 [Linnemannia gamsii]|uniref:Major facilitator superfamily (MFS) profile domain-containing protein n=1 Tax=Linnemannia gamsii TaxID=64522 RepID=A0A9P6QQZ1_9FUNG|nr:hypothetical protein BGZ97_008637 [Linnemannia gamsii]
MTTTPSENCIDDDEVKDRNATTYLKREFNLNKTQIGLVFLAQSIPTLTAPLAGAFSDKHGAK